MHELGLGDISILVTNTGIVDHTGARYCQKVYTGLSFARYYRAVLCKNLQEVNFLINAHHTKLLPTIICVKMYRACWSKKAELGRLHIQGVFFASKNAGTIEIIEKPACSVSFVIITNFHGIPRY